MKSTFSSPRLRAWIIAALLALLGGCSALRLSYNNGSVLAYWWLDAYVDFSAEQSPRVREALHDWFAWHRGDQLGEYAQWLAALRLQIAAPTTAAAVCGLVDDVKHRLERAYDQAVPAIAAIGRDLRPEQILHMERRFQKMNDEYRAEHLPVSSEERLRTQTRRAIDRAESLYGRLGETQRALVAAHTAASPFDAEIWLDERQARQQRILALARGLRAEGADEARIQEALRLLARQMAESPRPAYRDHARRVQEFRCAADAALHNSTDDAQRRRAANKIKGWEDDLRALAEQRP